VAISVCIYGFDCFGTLNGSRILRGSSANEMRCDCPGGCGGNILYISAYEGCHLIVYGWLWLSTTPITDDARPKIVDAHFQDVVGSVSLSLLPVKAANASFVTISNLSPPRLPKIHDQESLTLSRRSFWRWGRDLFTFSFAYKGSQYFVYDY